MKKLKSGANTYPGGRMTKNHRENAG